MLREEREEDPFADSLLGPFQNSQQEAHRVAFKSIWIRCFSRADILLSPGEHGVCHSLSVFCCAELSDFVETLVSALLFLSGSRAKLSFHDLGHLGSEMPTPKATFTS